jgi:hypothetical protein
MEDARRSRLLGLAFFAIVVVAIALLIVGYGVAVGAGALVGLVPGALAGLVGVLKIGRGPNSVVTFGEGYSATEPLQPTATFLSEMREISELSTVNLGAIRTVIPALTDVEAAGLSVTLVSVELHEAGIGATFDVASRPGASAMLSMANVSVRDDVGTDYRAGAQGQGGYPGPMRFLATAVPAPSAGATRLDITIERFFDPFPEGQRGPAGPWAFSISLPAPPS